MCPIVNTELDEDENLFLNSLTKSISENRINTLLDEIAKTEKATEENITAFIDASFFRSPAICGRVKSREQRKICGGSKNE
ncbi:MAG: hypothetical protein Ta2B_11850 [Termitinemataceae bacterium]|nr:MAG: hypothetical protein Ta2B_11850 [Termitinemataceae bacterium]